MHCANDASRCSRLFFSFGSPLCAGIAIHYEESRDAVRGVLWFLPPVIFRNRKFFSRVLHRRYLGIAFW